MIDRQTDRQTTDRQTTDRQTDRQTDISNATTMVKTINLNDNTSKTNLINKKKLNILHNKTTTTG